MTIDAAGWFDWATREPGPADRPAAPPYSNQRTAMAAVFHHSMEGYRSPSYSVLTDPRRFPTAWCGTVALDGTLYQHYDVRLALQASNAGNFTGPAFELEGVAGMPINAAQRATCQRIHADVAAFTGRTVKRVTTTKLDYAALQAIPAGELWLLEHRQVGETACPSGRYEPLWAALEGNVTREEYEDLLLAVFSGSEEGDLSRDERLTNARYRVGEIAEGRAQSVNDRAASAIVLAVEARDQIVALDHIHGG